MALDYASLPDDPEELKRRLLQHSAWIEALKAEVVRLRRWRFGRSSEVIDTAIAPELPLTGLVAQSSPVPQPNSEAQRPRSSRRSSRCAKRV